MLHAQRSGDGQDSHLRSSATAPGRGWLYLATAHSFVITLQRQHIENVTANTVLSQGDNKQAECSLSASRKSCLRLNLNINVATQGLCFAFDLVFSDGVRSVMEFALCKIEEQSEDFSKQRHAGRGVDMNCFHLAPQESRIQQLDLSVCLICSKTWSSVWWSRFPCTVCVGSFLP